MSSESEQEIDITRKLFLLCNGIAIGIPCCSLAIIYSYSLFFDVFFKRSDWRTIFFVIWLGTMLVLVKEGISKYREYRLRFSGKSRKAGSKRYKSENRVGAWEQRKTMRLSGELVSAALIIPSVSISIVYAYSYFFGVFFKRGDWKMVVFCVWIGVLVSLVRISIKASKEKVSYTQ